MFAPNVNALFADALPPVMAKELDILDGVLPQPLPSAELAWLIASVYALLLVGRKSRFFLRSDVLQYACFSSPAPSMIVHQGAFSRLTRSFVSFQSENAPSLGEVVRGLGKREAHGSARREFPPG